VLQINKLRLLQEDPVKDEEEEHPPLPIKGMPVPAKKKKALWIELPMVLSKEIIKELMPAGREPPTSIVESMYV